VYPIEKASLSLPSVVKTVSCYYSNDDCSQYQYSNNNAKEQCKGEWLLFYDNRAFRQLASRLLSSY